MRSLSANAAAWGLALLVGVTASAQTDKQAGRSEDQQDRQAKGEQGGRSKDRQGDDRRKQDSDKDQGQTERIRGELAGASVVGETMVDYESGRAIVAELTYLTILGSPAGAGRQEGQGGQADSGRGDAKRGDQDKDQDKDKDKGARSENKDQGSDRDRAGRDRGDQERSGERSANRRNVYHIAISPDTQVRARDSQGRRGRDSGDRPKGQGESSARERSQAALEQLEIGDRVEVEFTRLNPQGRSANGGEGQKGSTSQNRHGRHRIIRGVAKTIMIVSAPDRDGDRDGSENRKDGDSSSREKRSGSDSQKKDSDREK